MAPAVTLLVVATLVVGLATATQGKGPSSSSPERGVGGGSSAGLLQGEDQDTLEGSVGLLGPSPTGSATGAGAAAASSPVSPVVDLDLEVKAPNATLVFQCLEAKCQPLVSQLGQAWRDLANINLLRCLANAAVNKTAASVCFDVAGPSEIRDDLVACAGCNKCIALHDQTSIDDACAKYEAWSKKKPAAAAPASTLDPAVETSEPLTPQGEPGAAAAEPSTGRSGLSGLGDGTLLHNLPSNLWSRYCSAWWCP